MSVMAMPLAALVGAEVVSVAQAYSGNWCVMFWNRDAGPMMVGKPGAYQDACSSARRISQDEPGVVLDLPEHGLIHVIPLAGGGYEVLHESRSSDSFGSLGRFGPHERDEAIRFALGQLGQYAPCKLGDIA